MKSLVIILTQIIVIFSYIVDAKRYVISVKTRVTWSTSSIEFTAYSMSQNIAFHVPFPANFQRIPAYLQSM